MPFRLTTRSLALLALTTLIPPQLALAQDGDAGAYLAAQVAASGADYRAAAAWYARAMLADATNPGLLEGAVVANIGIGEMGLAADAARRLMATGAKSQNAYIAQVAELAQAQDYKAILALAAAGNSAGALLDDLVQAWAKLGLGQMADSLETYDKIAATKGLEAFGLYHKALALASAGDFEGADEILSGRAAGPLVVMRRGVIAHAQILSQLERNPDAIALLDRSFVPGNDLQVDDLRRRLVAGEPLPFDITRNATDGIAEVFFTMATALNGEADDGYTMIYTRVAAHLRPDHTEAILMTAALLEQQGQHDLAGSVYAQIAPADPAFHFAEMGRADAIYAAGRKEAALEVMQALARSHGNLLSVQVALGDALRREERFVDALRAYDAAIATLPTPGPQHWSLFYSRGICQERQGNFAAAETDMRRALDLEPDQPQVLNYLGYSLVDRGEKLDEALAMIERAVTAQPNSGYIIDSLAWAYYRLGRYDEALAPMEQASLLEPVDPIVTDHLGDVYWAVGRTREAEFQWHRALSFEPVENDAARIRLKIEKGLDAVLAAEGAAPLKPQDAAANED
jgi:tetratricopeptide (TPR) repeat protein